MFLLDIYVLGTQRHVAGWLLKYSGYLKIDGKAREVYFIGFIDDATRYIIHGEFYWSRNQTAVEDCFRKVILKEGLPQRVLFDNGKEFRNKWMERACAILNIKLICNTIRGCIYHRYFRTHAR